MNIQKLRPSPEVRMIQRLALHGPNPSKVVPLSVRLFTARPIPDQFREYCVLGRRYAAPYTHPTTKGHILRLTTLDLGFHVGISRSGKNVELGTRGKMNHIERSAEAQGLVNCFRIGVKSPRQIGYKSRYMFFPNIGHNIHVVR